MKIGMYHKGLTPTVICSNDDPGLAVTYFMASLECQILYFRRFYWKVETADFFRNYFIACDLKVGRCGQPIE